MKLTIKRPTVTNLGQLASRVLHYNKHMYDCREMDYAMDGSGECGLFIERSYYAWAKQEMRKVFGNAKGYKFYLKELRNRCNKNDYFISNLVFAYPLIGGDPGFMQSYRR